MECKLLPYQLNKARSWGLDLDAITQAFSSDPGPLLR